MPRITPFEILPSTAEIMQRPVRPVPTDMYGTPELEHIAERLLHTMKKTGAVGLAAPQVGLDMRMVAVEPNWKEPKLKQYTTVLVNPEIVPDINPATGEVRPTELEFYGEGCMSFLDLYVQIARPTRLAVVSHDITGRQHRQVFFRNGAQATGHELDHLDGIQMPDLPESRRRFMALKPRHISHARFAPMYKEDPQEVSRSYPFTDEEWHEMKISQAIGAASLA